MFHSSAKSRFVIINEISSSLLVIARLLPFTLCVPYCRHTEVDEHAIQHCFCYTSTVLTSTLAFQKEQKLKVECQVLHMHTDTHKNTHPSSHILTYAVCINIHEVAL